MKQCIDYNIGKLITQYELGYLSDRDRYRFERHLLDCDYCLEEIEAMDPIMDSVRKKRTEILEKLKTQGISYELGKQRILSRRRRFHSIRFWIEHALNWFIDTLKPRYYIPALVTASVVILISILPIKSPYSDNPYYRYLNFDKAPYQFERAAGQVEAVGLFLDGMEEYTKNNFQEAASLLTEATERNSDEGEWWLYLGVSHYLNRQANPAIRALYKADSLTSGTLNNRAKWFLAQSYLLEKNTQQARSMLEKLIEQNREYSSEAVTLLARVEKIMEKNSQE